VEAGRIAVAGYSFGAWVGLAEAVGVTRVAAVATVGLVPWRFDEDAEELNDGRVQFAAGYLHSLTRPKLFIAGERDTIAPAAALRTLIAHLPPPAALQVVAGADHSFQSHEREVGELIAGFLVDL
jgi:pimeloyl-ACP methyl ester carboxylesterase